jgi:hypothetical protein
VCDDAMGFADLNARSCRFRRGTRDHAAGRTLAADQHAGRIPVQIEGKSAVRAMVTIANTDACVAMHAPPNPRPGQVVR